FLQRLFISPAPRACPWLRAGTGCCQFGSRACIQNTKRQSTRWFLSASSRWSLLFPARLALEFKKRFNSSTTRPMFSTASSTCSCSPFQFSGLLLFVPVHRYGCGSHRPVVVLFHCLPFSSPSIPSSTCRTR